MYIDSEACSKMGYFERDYIDYHFEVLGKKVTIHKVFGVNRMDAGVYLDDHRIDVEGKTINHEELLSNEESELWHNTVNDHDVPSNLANIEPLLLTLIMQRHLKATK